ncbi:MAG TPA: hypothetical protein VIL72_06825 [Beijerinckiaceae bacterium]|jgi:hypothetical protein
MSDSAHIAERATAASEAPHDEAARDAAAARLVVRLTLAGFALMGVGALLMWVKFGPSIFMDLATAVIACF